MAGPVIGSDSRSVSPAPHVNPRDTSRPPDLLRCLILALTLSANVRDACSGPGLVLGSRDTEVTQVYPQER